MEPSGRVLYISNRRHDSVTVLSLDQENGKMHVVQNIRTCGEQPRFITVDPDGRQLLAANELSDSIQFFDIDEADGTLKESGTVIGTESPVCVVFMDK